MKRCISDSDEKYYTYLLKLINSLGGRTLKYNWLITDIEAYPKSSSKIDDMIKENEYLFLSTDELLDILEDQDFQWIWGVFSAIPETYPEEEVLKYKLPFAEDNKALYQEIPIIQHPLADIEVVAFDASFVQIVSNNDRYLELFKKTYPNAKEN